MAWETDRYGKARYVQKVRIDGRVISKILGTGEAGLAAERQVLIGRETRRKRKAELQERNSNSNIELQTLERILDESRICQGYIKRNGAWRLVSKLKSPLTTEEKSLIRRVKRSARSHSKKVTELVRNSQIDLL